VGLEIALATILLASAGLLVHSFVKVMNSDRGYDVERILAVDVSLFGEAYAPARARARFYDTLVDNARALPGVVAAGAISNLPAVSASSGAGRTVFYSSDTDFQRTVLARPVAMIRAVTPGYFAASGAHLRAGRFFSDNESRLAAVISESLARRMWPGESLDTVVGREIRHNLEDPLISIVGIVADEHPGALDREPPPALYRPYVQWPSGPMTLVVRAAQDPTSIAAALRAEVRKLDPNVPVGALQTMRAIVSTTVAERRFQMALTATFALLALLMGAIGVYSVVSYAVACRTREIGLRMALGAVSDDVTRWVVKSGMQPVVIGLMVGVVGSLAIARALRSFLFAVTTTDPLSFSAAVVLLLGASALACYLPARRASRLDPITALRHE
jgi:predicted permease